MYGDHTGKHESSYNYDTGRQTIYVMLYSKIDIRKRWYTVLIVVVVSSSFVEFQVFPLASDKRGIVQKRRSAMGLSKFSN